LIGMPPQLGRIGVWAHFSALTPSLAQELERIGFGTVWIGGSPDGGLSLVDQLLGATDALAVATGIVNIWKDDPHTVASSYRRVNTAFGDRFLLGIGVGHPEATTDYAHPYRHLVEYLDVLDAEDVPTGGRVLAALGPKVLRLSRDRSAGAHTYLVTPEHTRQARETLGAGVLLAPEQKIVLETDPEAARALGRPAVDRPYLGLGNYINNLKRLGWSDEDLQRPGSDALIDALVGRGEAAAAVGQVRHHLAAGADHVAIQLLTAKGADPVPQYRALADALRG